MSSTLAIERMLNARAQLPAVSLFEPLELEAVLTPEQRAILCAGDVDAERAGEPSAPLARRHGASGESPPMRPRRESHIVFFMSPTAAAHDVWVRMLRGTFRVVERCAAYSVTVNCDGEVFVADTARETPLSELEAIGTQVGAVYLLKAPVHGGVTAGGIATLTRLSLAGAEVAAT